MSTPKSHRSAHSPSASSTSQSARTPASDKSSFSVEPKSDVLRSALEARRARDNIATPSSSGSRPTPHQRAASSHGASAARLDDPWLEQAAESAPQAIPIRRGRRPSDTGMGGFSPEENPIRRGRRPSDTGMGGFSPEENPIRRGRRPSDTGQPRFPTQREQQYDDAMKNKMFNMSLQNELLKKQNNELKDKLDAADERLQGLLALEEKLDAAEERITQLQPLEEENIDLQDANNRLTIQVLQMDQEIVELEEQNREILNIQEEAVQNMEQQQVGLNEAVETIYQQERDMTALQEEILKLKAQLESARLSSSSTDTFQDSLDGPARESSSSRLRSIDDERPSTSHFDSDYYSQPGSPPANVNKSLPDVPSQAVKEKLSFRDRAKRAKMFEALSLSSKKSTNDLKMRFSNLSLMNLEHRPKSRLSPTQTHRPTRKSRSSQQTTPTASRVPRASEILQSPGYPPPLLPHKSSNRYAAAFTTSSDRLKGDSNQSLRSETTAASEYPESLPAPPSVADEHLTDYPDDQNWWKGVQGVRSSADTQYLGLSRNPSVTGSRNVSGAGSRKPSGSGPGPRDGRSS